MALENNPTQAPNGEPTKTELEIMEAAKELFFEKGFTATSTTDIARKAGCNQALVHYYYRTKENLFRQIYLTEVNKALALVSQGLDLLPSDVQLETAIESIVNVYFSKLKQNPQLPFFVLNELVVNPARRTLIRDNFMNNPLRQEAYYKFKAKIELAVQRGHLRAIEPFQLLFHVVSLCVSTFIAMPLYKDLTEASSEAYDALLEERKQAIVALLLHGLQPDEEKGNNGNAE